MFSWFGKKKVLELKAVMNGKIIGIEEVPDQVFSAKMLGDGFAVMPEDGLVVSPCDGTVAHVFPTGHAIGIVSEDGIEILIHIGIDTVELKGEGFSKKVEAGAKVKVGTPLVQADLAFIEGKGKSLITPVVITGGPTVEMSIETGKVVKAGLDTTAILNLK